MRKDITIWLELIGCCFLAAIVMIFATVFAVAIYFFNYEEPYVFDWHNAGEDSGMSSF